MSIFTCSGSTYMTQVNPNSKAKACIRDTAENCLTVTLFDKPSHTPLPFVAPTCYFQQQKNHCHFVLKSISFRNIGQLVHTRGQFSHINIK